MTSPNPPSSGKPDPAALLALGLATQSAAAATAATPPLSPDELAAEFPRLEILELLGRGGMGAVYKARQRDLDRLVALKILRPGLDADPGFAERFTREARALAQLNHPGIVTLYEFGKTSAGRYFILMEFVDGMNLRQLLAAGRLSPREALAIVPPLCDALQYAHDRGLIHRDIKPENLLIDRLGRIKIADFGISRLASEGRDGSPSRPSGNTSPILTSVGEVMGTPAYMAPEQRDRPAEVDHRADLYALGVVFYQMLTGELPAAGQLQPPSHRVQLDVRLDEIVLRALEKDPARRYAAASDFKTQIETVATGTFRPPANQTTLKKRFYRIVSSRWFRFFPVAVLLLILISIIKREAAPANPPNPALTPPPAPISAPPAASPSPVLKTKQSPVAEDLSLKVESGELILKALAWQDEIEAKTGKPWSPSGVPIPDSLRVPALGQMEVLGLDGKQHTRILSLSFQQKPYDAQSLLEVVMMNENGLDRVKGANTTSSRNSSYQTGDEFGWHSLSLDAGPAETIPKHIVLNIRSTFGRWTRIDEITGDFKSTKAFSEGVFRNAPTEDREGYSYINLVRNHALNASTTQYGFVAVAKDGRRIASVITQGTSGNGVSSETHRFRIPLNDVLKFECYQRPVHVTSIPIKMPTQLAGDHAPEIQQTNEWLSLVDSGDYAKSWDNASASLRKQVTQDDWSAACRKARGAQGTSIVSRELKNIQSTTVLPGSAEGRYCVLQFTTVINNESFAETVTMMQESPDNWQVAGYLIRPRTALETTVVAEALSWLSVIDQEHYEASWDYAADSFRKALTRGEWNQRLTSARTPLGETKFRQISTTQTVSNLPGAPDGHYVVMTFNTAFEHKHSAVETVTFEQTNDGTWRASGYFIK
jgi:serine/threonine protein kinase